MKQLIIYHGSEDIIKNPVFGYGNIHNDYGPGFYCTEDKQMAGEWACKRGNNGYINEYRLALEGLKVLNLLDKKYTVLNWMALLLANRTFRIAGQIGNTARSYIVENYLVDVAGYDIIKGYRADDSYFSFAQAFVENTLSLQALNKALYLGKLGEQIVLSSQQAYKNLKYLGAESARAEIYHPMFKLRDSMARKKFRQEVSSMLAVKNDLFVLDIMRMGLKNDDLRL